MKIVRFTAEDGHMPWNPFSNSSDPNADVAWAYDPSEDTVYTSPGHHPDIAMSLINQYRSPELEKYIWGFITRWNQIRIVSGNYAGYNKEKTLSDEKLIEIYQTIRESDEIPEIYEGYNNVLKEAGYGDELLDEEAFAFINGKLYTGYHHPAIFQELMGKPEEYGDWGAYAEQSWAALGPDQIWGWVSFHRDDTARVHFNSDYLIGEYDRDTIDSNLSKRALEALEEHYKDKVVVRTARIHTGGNLTNAFIYGDGKLIVEDRPHPQIVREHFPDSYLDDLQAGLIFEEKGQIYPVFHSYTLTSQEHKREALKALEIYYHRPIREELDYDEAMRRVTNYETKIKYVDHPVTQEFGDNTNAHALIYDSAKNVIYIGPFESSHAELVQAILPEYSEDVVPGSFFKNESAIGYHHWVRVPNHDGGQWKTGYRDLQGPSIPEELFPQIEQIIKDHTPRYAANFEKKIQKFHSFIFMNGFLYIDENPGVNHYELMERYDISSNDLYTKPFVMGVIWPKNGGRKGDINIYSDYLAEMDTYNPDDDTYIDMNMERNQRDSMLTGRAMEAVYDWWMEHFRELPLTVYDQPITDWLPPGYAKLAVVSEYVPAQTEFKIYQDRTTLPFAYDVENDQLYWTLGHHPDIAAYLMDQGSNENIDRWPWRFENFVWGWYYIDDNLDREGYNPSSGNLKQGYWWQNLSPEKQQEILDQLQVLLVQANTTEEKTSANLPKVIWVGYPYDDEEDEGPDYHGNGLPFVYLPQSDTLVIAEEAVFHTEMFRWFDWEEMGRNAPTLQEYKLVNEAEQMIPGRVDAAGDVGFYIAPGEQKDRIAQALKLEWPKIESLIDFDEEYGELFRPGESAETWMKYDDEEDRYNIVNIAASEVQVLDYRKSDYNPSSEYGDAPWKDGRFPILIDVINNVIVIGKSGAHHSPTYYRAQEDYPELNADWSGWVSTPKSLEMGYWQSTWPDKMILIWDYNKGFNNPNILQKLKEIWPDYAVARPDSDSDMGTEILASKTATKIKWIETTDSHGEWAGLPFFYSVPEDVLYVGNGPALHIELIERAGLDLTEMEYLYGAGGDAGFSKGFIAGRITADGWETFEDPSELSTQAARFLRSIVTELREKGNPQTVSRFKRLANFKIVAADVPQLAQKAMDKLLNREDMVKWKELANQEYADAVDEKGEENVYESELPEYFTPYGRLIALLNKFKMEAPETYKMWPWFVREYKKGRANDVVNQTRHYIDILTQSKQHLDKLRDNPRPDVKVPDINQMTFQELEDWTYERNNESAQELDVDPNTKVVYKFDNGWIIKKLGEQDLAREGELMGHCVGGYCNAVRSGESIIYSLRDEKNEPHATIEFQPGQENKLILIQVQGKGNREPVDEYKQMIKSFFDNLKKNNQIIGTTDYIAYEYDFDDWARQRGNFEEYGITDVGTPEVDWESLLDDAITPYGSINLDEDAAARLVSETGTEGVFSIQMDLAKDTAIVNNVSPFEEYVEEARENVERRYSFDPDPTLDESDYQDEEGEFDQDAYDEAYNKMWDQYQRDIENEVDNEARDLYEAAKEDAIGELEEFEYRVLQRLKWIKSSAADKDGAMIALYVPNTIAKQIKLKDGEPIPDLHITLAYFVDKAKERDDWDDVASIVEDYAQELGNLKGEITGYGTFNGKDGTVLWAKPEIEDLDKIQKELVKRVEAAGFEVSKEHDFNPHITLMYGHVGDIPTLEEAIPVDFNELVFVVAEKKKRKKLAFGGFAGSWIYFPDDALNGGLRMLGGDQDEQYFNQSCTGQEEDRARKLLPKTATEVIEALPFSRQGCIFAYDRRKDKLYLAGSDRLHINLLNYISGGVARLTNPDASFDFLDDFVLGYAYIHWEDNEPVIEYHSPPTREEDELIQTSIWPHILQKQAKTSKTSAEIIRYNDPQLSSRNIFVYDPATDKLIVGPGGDYHMNIISEYFFDENDSYTDPDESFKYVEKFVLGYARTFMDQEGKVKLLTSFHNAMSLPEREYVENLLKEYYAQNGYYVDTVA